MSILVIIGSAKARPGQARQGPAGPMPHVAPGRE